MPRVVPFGGVELPAPGLTAAVRPDTFVSGIKCHQCSVRGWHWRELVCLEAGSGRRADAYSFVCSVCGSRFLGFRDLERGDDVWQIRALGPASEEWRLERFGPPAGPEPGRD